jgi:transglutaminase-like putative cysteine protease
MLASGYFAVVLSGYLDLPTAILTVVALCLRFLMVARILSVRISGKAVAVAAVAYAGFYPLDYLYFSRGFLPATVHLVFFVAIVKLVTARTLRDYAFLKLIAGMELLAAALLSTGISFFVLLALFLLFSIATFSSGEVVASLRRAQLGTDAAGTDAVGANSHEAPPGTASVTATAPLVRLARGGQAKFPRRLGGFSAALLAGILLMTGGMFFVLPRTARAALQRFVPQRYHLPGFSNEVTLGDIGEIQQRSTPVMHIRSYAGEGLLPVRWRGGSLSQFDGKRWFNPPESPQPIRAERGVVTLRAGRHWRPGHSLAYQVVLNDTASDVVFYAGTPETIRINAPLLDRMHGEGLRVPGRFMLYGGLTYSVYSYIEDESGQMVTAASPLPAGSREEYLQLPPLDPRIPVLARDMTSGATSEMEQARAMEGHLRRDYGYTLQLLSAEVADPLANFLFVRKKGHCEYFASAMTVMLRTLGVPARVATGFQSGVYNPMTGWQVVRASDAHSWVEAWISGRGWVSFDPTPPDPGGSAQGMFSRLSLLLDAADQFWENWVLSYDFERQIALASRMQQSGQRMRFNWFDNLGSWLDQASAAGRTHAIAILSALGSAIVLLLMGPGWIKWLRRRAGLLRASRGRGQASDGTLLYRRMLMELERRGIQKPPWLTPVEFARVLPASRLALLVNDLTAAYNQFRFGQRRDAAPRMILLLDEIEKLP